MTTGCPTCGRPATRQGTKARRVLDLVDGHPEIALVRAQRWRCPACASYFTALPDVARPRGLATIEARDAVAETCFVAGYAAAAARFGIDEKTARSLWHEWAEPREHEIPDQAPGFAGIHLATVAGGERAVVTDVYNMTLVDVLTDGSESTVSGWLGRKKVDAMRICVISFSQPLRDAVTLAAPLARIMVCPAHAAERGNRAFVAAFRTVRRLVGRIQGSNAREDVRLFVRPATDLSIGNREDMSAWDEAVLDLYRARERFSAALAAGSEQEARTILDDARKRCLAIPGAGQPAAFIGEWAAEIAAGVGARHLDPFSDLLEEMANAWTHRRPPLPFDLARGLAVLKDGPRVLVDADGRLVRAGGEPAWVRRSVGVAMADVIAGLALAA